MTRRATVALGITIALLLGLDGLALATREPEARTRVLSPELAQVVPELERFVEQTRGLQFRELVDVELVDREAMAEARHREADLGGMSGPLVPTGELDGGALLAVLGLLTEPIDMDNAIDEAEDDGVIGVYFPRQRRLLVVGDETTPFVRSVLVHELTHALDDQHFDLAAGDPGGGDDEASLSYLALVEGDAVSVEERYLASLPKGEFDAAARERESAADLSGTPEAILDLLSYPYAAGSHFVEAVRERRGNAGINAAFANPPTTSEHILRPDSFFARETPQPVAKPVPQGDVVGRGVLGVMQLALMLRQSMDQPTVRAALEGWNGDRFVAWTDGGRVCLAATIATDSGQDAATLAGALQTWLNGHPAGAVTPNGVTVILQRCA